MVNLVRREVIETARTLVVKVGTSVLSNDDDTLNLPRLRNLVEEIHQLVVGSFQPGLVLILDIPESIALQRAASRGDNEDRFEKKGVDYHSKVRQAFRQISISNPERYCLIDANQSIDHVSRQILEAVNRHFHLSLELSDGD